MTLLNLIVLAVCCLALESKKKTKKQTTNERERERERRGLKCTKSQSKTIPRYRSSP
jgi:hypothetical protein